MLMLREYLMSVPNVFITRNADAAMLMQREHQTYFGYKQM